MDHKGKVKESSNLPHLMNLTVKETSLLQLLREKKYSKIEIEMKNGEIGQVYLDEEMSTTNTKLEDIIRGNAFQTITVTQHDGNLVRIKRRLPVRLD